MDKNNRFKDFLRKLVENIVIQLIISLAIVLGVIYILKDFILSFLSYSQQTFMPLWMTIVIVIAVIFFIFLFAFLLKKRRRIPWLVSSFRTRTGDEQEISFPLNGLNWIAYIPKQLFKPDEYVWLTGPFCPDCACELKWKGRVQKSWYCERCNKNFKAFKRSARDEREFVKDIVYADIFRKKKFQDKKKPPEPYYKL